MNAKQQTSKPIFKIQYTIRNYRTILNSKFHFLKEYDKKEANIWIDRSTVLYSTLYQL